MIIGFGNERKRPRQCHDGLQTVGWVNHRGYAEREYMSRLNSQRNMSNLNKQQTIDRNGHTEED